MRNFAFIDSNNLHLGIRDQGWTLDYRRFREYLRAKYDVVRAYMFMGYVPHQQKLYAFLEAAGFIVIFKKTSGFGATLKGNCDAELVLRAMIDFAHYKSAIIVTGDGDFACLVEYLREQGKLRCLIAPDGRRCSILLKDAAQKYFASLNKLRIKLEVMKRTPVGWDRVGDFSS